MINTVVIMASGVMTGTNVIHSTALDTGNLTHVAFEATWTGDPSGTFAVEGSLQGANWTDLEAGIDAVTTASGVRLVNLSDVAFRYARLSYTNSAGNGVMTVAGEAKS